MLEKTHSFQPSFLHAVSRRLLMAAGTPRHIADVVSEILVEANLRGYDSHGLIRIPVYLPRIFVGGVPADREPKGGASWAKVIDPAAEPEVVEETDTTVVFDACAGFGHYAARKAMDLAIEKARKAHVCCVSLHRIGHMGRLGEYVEAAVRAGCIGIVTFGGGGKGGGRIVPFGGADGVLSTNPIAIGVPTGDDRPFILDYATSAAAEGKLKVARSENADLLPEGFILDKHGLPSVSLADFDDGGYLLPFGQHKGYGLSLFVGLLGALSGNFGVEQGTVSGAFMQVINVGAFLPLSDYHAGVQAFLDSVRSVPTVQNFETVLVHGDRARCTRAERLAKGIELPDTVFGEIQECAEKLDVSLDKSIVETVDVKRYGGG